MRKHPKDLMLFREGYLANARQDNEGLKGLPRAKASQVILRVRKHPKDLLPF